MLEACWGQVDQICLPYRLTFHSQLLDGRSHIDRIPSHHGIGEQIQAASLVGLSLFLFAPQRASVGEKEKLPQGMKRFALVELRVDPAAVVLTFEVAQQEER